jgi:hypothetical protein
MKMVKCHCSAIVLSLLLAGVFTEVGLAGENESVQYFKMLSTVEYSGKNQFKNQIESLFTTRKQSVSDDKVRYLISSNDFELGGSGKEFSFIVDERTHQISGLGRDLTLVERVNNECVKSVEKVSAENIGKTWKQSFDLSFLGEAFPQKLEFTLTAIKLETAALGELMAVRALSEPFVVKAVKSDGQTGDIKSRIGAVYLFDSQAQQVYMSISAFEVGTNINGFNERLRHEVATYMTDALGTPVDLKGLDKKFEKLVKKVGLVEKNVKVKKEAPLPQWAKAEGLFTSQIAGVCAAIACEGALNPVAMICMPVARTLALQSFGTLASVSGATAVSTALTSSVPAVGGMNLAGGATIMGVGVGTAGAVAGGTVGTVAAAGGGGGGGSSGGGGGGAATPASP